MEQNCELLGNCDEIRYGAPSLICLAGRANGIMQFGPRLAFVFSFMNVPDRSEAMRVAISVLGEKHPRRSEVLLDALKAARPGQRCHPRDDGWLATTPAGFSRRRLAWLAFSSRRCWAPAGALMNSLFASMNGATAARANIISDHLKKRIDANSTHHLIVHHDVPLFHRRRAHSCRSVIFFPSPAK